MEERTNQVSKCATVNAVFCKSLKNRVQSHNHQFVVIQIRMRSSFLCEYKYTQPSGFTGIKAMPWCGDT